MTNFAYSMVQIFQTEKGYRLSSQLLVAIFRIFPIHLVFPVFPPSSIATIYVFHISCRWAIEAMKRQPS
jgi:hypothetical protein